MFSDEDTYNILLFSHSQLNYHLRVVSPISANQTSRQLLMFKFNKSMRLYVSLNKYTLLKHYVTECRFWVFSAGKCRKLSTSNFKAFTTCPKFKLLWRWIECRSIFTLAFKLTLSGALYFYDLQLITHESNSQILITQLMTISMLTSSKHPWVLLYLVVHQNSGYTRVLYFMLHVQEWGLG